MMYNTQFINIHYAMIDAFMIKVDYKVLDVSYTIELNKLIIQVVLLEGSNLCESIKHKARRNLFEFDLSFKEIHISKQKYNENIGEWTPKYYKWLNYLLFSKAEVL